jgi:hypothetical protein
MEDGRDPIFEHFLLAKSHQQDIAPTLLHIPAHGLVKAKEDILSNAEELDTRNTEGSKGKKNEYQLCKHKHQANFR